MTENDIICALNEKKLRIISVEHRAQDPACLTLKVERTTSALDDRLDALGYAYSIFRNSGKSRTALAHYYIQNLANIDRVIFNPPATIIFWTDGTKTVVKCGEHEEFDPEKGLAMAITKKAFGNEGNYYNMIKKWLPESRSYGCSDPFAGIVSKAIDQLGDIAEKFERRLLGND